MVSALQALISKLRLLSWTVRRSNFKYGEYLPIILRASRNRSDFQKIYEVLKCHLLLLMVITLMLNSNLLLIIFFKKYFFFRDTAGLERFKRLTFSYYHRAMGIMLVYDVTDERSFESIVRWQRDIDEVSSSVKRSLKLLSTKSNFENT